VILESGDELIFNDLEREQTKATEGQSVNNSAETEAVSEESNASTNAIQEISNALDEVSTSNQQARASVGLEPDQQMQAELNRLNNIKIYWSVFNIDVANSENLGGDGDSTITSSPSTTASTWTVPLVWCVTVSVNQCLLVSINWRLCKPVFSSDQPIP